MSASTTKKKLNINSQPFNIEQPEKQPHHSLVHTSKPYQPKNEIQEYFSQKSYTPIDELAPDFNYHKSTQHQQEPAQVVNQNQGPKEKKKLRKTHYEFQVDPNLAEKIDQKSKEELELQKLEEQRKIEEEKLKLEQEELRRQEELIKLEELRKQEEENYQPRPYTKEQLESMFANMNDFQYFESDINWIKIKDRKHFDYKEFKRYEQRKDSKIPTQKKDTKTEIQLDRQPVQQNEPPQKFPKRAQISIQEQLWKDKLKQEAYAWSQILDTTPEQKKAIEKDLKYRLNQLAPDNEGQVSKYIIETIEQNQDFIDFLTEKIIEKAQIEPKYRGLYINLCSKLATLPSLQLKVQDKNGKTKQQSKFKASLLNRVQKMFNSRKTMDYDTSKLKQEEKIQFHMIRKRKIMGNVRFIGGLYLTSLLPIQALSSVLSELMGEYLIGYVPKEDTADESLEGLIELIDQIGQSFNQNERIVDEAFINKIGQILNGQKKSLDQIEGLFRDIKKQTVLDLMQKVFEKLLENYHFSQRIRLLIENLLDKIKKGWQGSYAKKEELAESAQKNNEQEEDDPLELQLREARQNSAKKENSSNELDQKIRAKDIAMFVSSSFQFDPVDQMDKLRGQLKYIKLEAPELMIVFFETFFQNMLASKQVKQNIERAQLVFDLLVMEEADEEVVSKALQYILDEDLVYNISESKTSWKLITNILSYFILEQNWNALKKLYLKPLLDIEEFNEFLIRVGNQLIIQIPDQSGRELIVKYFNMLKQDLSTQLNFD
ncbi:unnamed protein product (macronuclear) [Paramecium tetraurelia]|uniref:MIF4G domain-containing protein n=1 Tax=Paramecium tetraurelia TaxID=5888 RepID=A0DLF9_PARTE|nr:uncharacterized protein GSPATT00018193001 [Paramecium tetraurelia]CAK83876.1 unnamed protein product [Paramecium tetraurelia]|eukprot:XP_001451273.1 hypothetical protein (macronuclear) [Paramecium tetraurelia strain d4-2]